MNPAITPQPEQPLSQLERVVDTFTSPARTFRDINRSASWWLPLVIISVVSFAFIFVVDKKVGFDTVLQNQLRMTPKAERQLEQMPPAARQQQLAVREKATRIFSYGWPVLGLVMFIIMGAVLLGSFNFILGTQVRFGQSVAIVVYGNLVGILKAVIAGIAILAGANSDSFILQNPVATNLGYFLDPSKGLVLYTLATSIDLVTIWTLALVALGFTCISKAKKPAAFAIVFGWWAFLTLLQVAGAAMSS